MKRTHQITALMLTAGLAWGASGMLFANPGDNQPQLRGGDTPYRRGPGRQEQLGPRGERDDFAPQRLHGGPEGRPGGPLAPRAFWRDEELRAAINLSQEQIDALEQGYTSQESAAQALREEIDALREKQRAALTADNVDENEVLARVDEISSRNAQLRKLELKQRLLVQRTLSDEQKAGLREFAAERVRANRADRREARADFRAERRELREERRELREQRGPRPDDERPGRGPRGRVDGRGRGPHGPDDQPLPPPVDDQPLD